MKSARRGFTLVEMLIVMATVALLLSIAAPRYFGSLERSRHVALQENLNVLRSTLDKFYGDKGRYPDSLDELVTQKYLRMVPVDPITESAQTWILIPATETQARGIVDIKSGAPGLMQDGRAYDAL